MDEIESFAVAGLAAPHPLAAAAGREILIEGGNLIEAAIAAAAVSAVVVPDRNGLGGDAVWLIREPGPRGRTRVLDGRGLVGAAARLSYYRQRNLESVPLHGADSVLVAPGAVAAWIEARALSAAMGGRLPLERLLTPAIKAARDGWSITARDIGALAAAAPTLSAAPGFVATFLVEGELPKPDTLRRNPALGATLDYLATKSLEDLYRGDVGREFAADLAALPTPLARDDLRGTEARWREPHLLDLGRHSLSVPPTRSGLWAAVTLGLYAGLGDAGLAAAAQDGFERWHGLVASLRAADEMLDAAESAGAEVADVLDVAKLGSASLALDRERAARAAPEAGPLLDEAAVWIGVVDRDGGAVSLVQTLGGAFGSGAVSRRTGILLGNRGAALAVDPDLGPVLRPGRRPPLRALPAIFAAPKEKRVAAFGAEGRQAVALVSDLVSRLIRGASLGDLGEAPRIGLGATPDGRDVAVLVEEERQPGAASRLRSAGHVLVPVDGLALRRAGLVLRDEAGRLAATSDEGAVAGL